MIVTYSNFCGMVVGETRDGVEYEYIPDTMGSPIGIRDSDGNVTDTWEYWPYGEVAHRTGSHPTELTFLGTLGYVQDALDRLFYVRARHLRPDLARWLTVDPLWPEEPAYSYVGGRPVDWVDPSGKKRECFVRNCRMYNMTGGWHDLLVPYHAYVCGQSPLSQCVGGLPGNTGDQERGNPCKTSVFRDATNDWILVQCETLTVDCGLAALACKCVSRILRKNPPSYSFPFHVCYDFVQDVRECVCAELGLSARVCKGEAALWKWDRW